MPLDVNGERIITAHASKTSKINLGLFEAHTSVLIPFMVIPATLFTLTISASIFKAIFFSCCVAVLVLIILERRGITLASGLKRIRSRLMSRNRYSSTKGRFKRRLVHNSLNRK